jgi:hypothetical protein
MSFEPIVVDMEVAESEQPLDMDVAEQIVVNPPAELYTKLAETELTLNTTNTSAVLVGTINVPIADIWTSNEVIYVAIRDKAGKRSGYCLGSDTWFANANAAEGVQSNFTAAARVNYTCENDLYKARSMSTSYGVYAGYISPNGAVSVYTRYNAAYGTINGTYKVEVYKLAFPDGVSPFV